MITAQIAKRMFDRYRLEANGLSVNSTPIPTWEKLPDNIRGYWIAAAEEARLCMREGIALEPYEEAQIKHAIHFVKNFGSARISGSNGFILLAKLAVALGFK